MRHLSHSFSLSFSCLIFFFDCVCVYVLDVKFTKFIILNIYDTKLHARVHTNMYTEMGRIGVFTSAKNKYIFIYLQIHTIVILYLCVPIYGYNTAIYSVSRVLCIRRRLKRIYGQVYCRGRYTKIITPTIQSILYIGTYIYSSYHERLFPCFPGMRFGNVYIPKSGYVLIVVILHCGDMCC